jgi:hypothetical protein
LTLVLFVAAWCLPAQAETPSRSALMTAITACAVSHAEGRWLCKAVGPVLTRFKPNAVSQVLLTSLGSTIACHAEEV